MTDPRTLEPAPATAPRTGPAPEPTDPGPADAHTLVARVRAAAAVHAASWEALVPDRFTVDLAGEAAEEEAYAAMAVEKAALRRHVCDTYGISIRELASLAMP